VIVSGEAVPVSETVGGDTAPAVVEGGSVDVNGEDVQVIFDGKNAIVNGEIVQASVEGGTVEIDGDEVSVEFDGDEVIVNGEAVSEAVPAAAVAKGEALAPVIQGVSEAVVPAEGQPNQWFKAVFEIDSN